MTRIVVDESLRTKLHDLSQRLELCDDSGRILARLIPLPDPKQFDLEPKISKEELERRRSSNSKTYTTAEVIEYLEKL